MYGQGAQGGHLDIHTAPKLKCYCPKTYNYVRTDRNSPVAYNLFHQDIYILYTICFIRMVGTDTQYSAIVATVIKAAAHLEMRRSAS